MISILSTLTLIILIIGHVIIARIALLCSHMPHTVTQILASYIYIYSYTQYAQYTHYAYNNYVLCSCTPQLYQYL